MKSLNASIALVVASLFMAGTAMAASLQPASGETLSVNQVEYAPSTLTRSAVEAEAAAALPAAGEAPFALEQVATSSTLTRAEVRAEAIANPPAAGVMNGVEKVAAETGTNSNDVQVANTAAGNRY